MPHSTLHRTGELLRVLFKLLIDEPNGLRASEALKRLSQNIDLSEYEKGFYESGGQRFEKMVRFATIDCVKAGWLAKDKGVWTITDRGQEAFNTLKNPKEFYKEAVRLYQAWKSTRITKDVDAVSVDNPDSEFITSEEELETANKAVSVTFEEAEEQAWEEISQLLTEMHPYDFQELVADLLRAMAYHVNWVAPPGKDGGIDILAGNDPLGTRPPRIKVQVKRQKQAVSVEGLRSFLAILGDEDVGLFVCTGGFTRDAEMEARTQAKRRITLLNLETLFDLWVEHYGKLTDSARRKLPLKPIYFLAPSGS